MSSITYRFGRLCLSLGLLVISAWACSARVDDFCPSSAASGGADTSSTGSSTGSSSASSTGSSGLVGVECAVATDCPEAPPCYLARCRVSPAIPLGECIYAKILNPPSCVVP